MPFDGLLRRVGRSRAFVSLTLLALALAPAVARATVPGHWDPVTAPTGANIDQVALVRTPDGLLHVVWHQDPPGSDVGTALTHTVSNAKSKAEDRDSMRSNVEAAARVGSAESAVAIMYSTRANE